MLRTIGSYVSIAVGFPASLVTLYLFAKLCIPELSSEALVAVWGLIIFAMYFLVRSLYLQAVYQPSSKYGECLGILNDAFVEVHKLFRTDFGHDSISTALVAVCDSTARALSLLSGSNCSVCIKMLFGQEDGGELRLRAITRARDRISGKRRTPEQEEPQHWLDLNSDFVQISSNMTNPNRRFYFCNRLPFLYNYHNTSFEKYGRPYDGSWIFGNWIRWWRWPLPYKSTLVVPIYDVTNKDSLVGFLCADSPSMGAFRLKHNLDLVSGVADGIYNVLAYCVNEDSGE